MYRFLFYVIILCAIIAPGCTLSGNISTGPYIPQNIVRYNCSIDIDDFTYRPYKPAPDNTTKKNDRKSTRTINYPNQIENTVADNIFLPMPIAEYFKKAIGLELEKSGVKLQDNAPIALHGEVITLKTDDFGYSIDWTFAIKYSILSKATGEVLYEKTFEHPKYKSGKFGNYAYADVTNYFVYWSYNSLIKDANMRAVCK